MDTTLYIAFIGPMCLMAILVNTFFCFSLLRPRDQNEALQQPLKVLLLLLVNSNICLQIIVFVYLFTNVFPQLFKVQFLVVYMTSVTISAHMFVSKWLSIFYYTRIVPAQRAFFIWTKRNIKTIVYCGLILDTFLIISEFTSLFFFSILLQTSESFTGKQNLTREVHTEIKTIVSFVALNLSFWFSFIVFMALSWISTLVYLCRHMKQMQMNNNLFSSTGRRRQLRVTIMGITHTALSLLFFLWSFLYGYCISKYDQNYFIVETIFFFLSFGTTVNLGLGQSLLRKKTADLFNKVHQMARKKGLVQP